MRVEEFEGEATHSLTLNRAEAFELLQELSRQLADEKAQEIELYIFQDDSHD